MTEASRRDVPPVTTRDGLPPGPPLPRWVQTALLLGGWSYVLRACRRRYGSTFCLDLAMLGRTVYVTDPAHLKQVFAGDPELFRAGEANGTMLRALLGDTSVLVVDGAEHRDRRKLMLPPFHREAVRRQADVIAQITADDVARWPVGTPFPVARRTAGIALEVILRVVIGSSDPRRRARLRELLPRVANVGLLEGLAMVRPSLLARRPWRAFGDRMAEVDRLLRSEIAACRATAPGERTDVLAMLVAAADDHGRAMDDVELRDQLVTLLFAGHETTATGLAWTLERLVRHPELLARAVGAAEAGDDGHDYLDAVIKESLRVRPVVFDVGRTLAEPVEIGGYRLPAGVMVAPGIGLVHTDPAIYPDPERFDPDRMLGATPAPTSWLPFGGGGRRCLGATFALVEMRAVLAGVLRAVELETTSARGELTKVRHVTQVPHRGGRVTVARRR